MNDWRLCLLLFQWTARAAAVNPPKRSLLKNVETKPSKIACQKRLKVYFSGRKHTEQNAVGQNCAECAAVRLWYGSCLGRRQLLFDARQGSTSTLAVARPLDDWTRNDLPRKKSLIGAAEWQQSQLSRHCLWDLFMLYLPFLHFVFIIQPQWLSCCLPLLDQMPPNLKKQSAAECLLFAFLLSDSFFSSRTSQDSSTA